MLNNFLNLIVLYAFTPVCTRNWYDDWSCVECCKGDRCKEMREKKQKDEQKQLEVLSQRNQILEQHARGLEIELKDYKTQTEERFNKLATLIASLK
jgi:hypothetical protein